MKFGLSAFAWTSAFEAVDLEMVGRVREWGYEGLEVAMFEPGRLDARGIRRAFEAEGMDCTVCAILPQGVNPVDPDGAVRRRAWEHLAACVETAGEMGAKVIGGPVYAPIGYLPGHRAGGEEMGWVVEMVQSVVPRLEALGMTLGLEPVNRAETYLVRTGAEAAAICEAVGSDRVGVTIDTFHANIEEKSIAGAVKALGRRVVHLHASENDRGVLGRGHVDFAGVLAALGDYEGYVVVEGFGVPDVGRVGPGTLLAEVGVSAEVLGRESLRYLRGLSC